MRHELREPRERALVAVRSGRGTRPRWRAHGATAAGHGTGTRPRSAPERRRHPRRRCRAPRLREPGAAGCRAGRFRRRAGHPDRLVRQVGDRQHEAPRERGQPAPRRRNQSGLGRLHGLRQAAGGAGEDQGPPGARASGAWGRGRSTRVPPRTAGRQARALKSERRISLSERKHPTMDLLTTAKNIADRVETESFKQNVPVAVTIIDNNGNVVLTHRMTGAPACSLELAERKAYTSALVGMRTADLVPLVQPGAALYPLLAVSGGRYSAMGGGVPLTSDGEVIAGVGVSGGTTEQDIAIVEAAMGYLVATEPVAAAASVDRAC